MFKGVGSLAVRLMLRGLYPMAKVPEDGGEVILGTHVAPESTRNGVGLGDPIEYFLASTNLDRFQVSRRYVPCDVHPTTLLVSRRLLTFQNRACAAVAPAWRETPGRMPRPGAAWPATVAHSSAGRSPPWG